MTMTQSKMDESTQSNNVLFTDEQLNEKRNLCEFSASLTFGDLGVKLFSNNEALLSELTQYYKSYVSPETQEAIETQTIEVYFVEQANTGDDLDWLEVPREVGKTGKKEGYLDVEGGRWIKKFKTGMCFLQRKERPVAVGQCAENLAQMVNFINNQFLNHHLRQGFMLGHAAAFSRVDESGVASVTAIAAGSGGGKSTTMLRCLEDELNAFLTNDRLLFVKRDAVESDESIQTESTQTETQTIGLAKLPRVNPGTLLHSDRLRHILPEARQKELLELPQSELWTLEEKYDVQIEDEYGKGRVALKGEFKNLVMLDWSLNSDEPTQLKAVDLQKEPEQIEGLRKRPGPFYQDENGKFADLDVMDSTEKYCDALSHVNVYRLTGNIDFDRAFELINAL
ncbi:HprK-related kinase B [Marinomonas balearica]|uniref:HprK-related kinase B n=1 Tax=Marinomonas balearica TaxID=491947 RepID=A0A4R6MDZ9_9GAMM|nr:HprK-related kinase B [Marinomonas balearica]TDO98950.1 HprK-related kinase B [Marinomonas balearica]